jgi:hypothetical protein
MLDRDPWPPRDDNDKSESSLKMLEAVRSFFKRLPFNKQESQTETESVNLPKEEE